MGILALGIPIYKDRIKKNNVKEIKKYSCVYKPDKSNIKGLSLLPPVNFYIFNNNKKYLIGLQDL